MAKVTDPALIEQLNQLEAQAGQPSGELTWAEVPGQAVQNLGPSAKRFAESVAYPFLNPVETLTALRDLGVGVASKAAGLVVEQDPEAKAKREAAANAVGQFLVDRYGSIDAFKRTLATDPVGAAADISMIMTGGAAAAGRAPGAVGQAARAVGAAGRAIDPLLAAGRVAGAAGRGVGRFAAGGLGLTTGVGTRPFQTAFEAGRKGNRALVEGMRGQRPIEEVVDMAKNAVSKMRADRSAAYVAGTQGLRNAQQSVNLRPINRAFAQANASLKYRGYVKDPKAASALKEAVDVYKDFITNFGTGTTGTVPPEALDALKQRINAIRETTQPGTNANRVVGQIYNSIGKEIRRQVPSYDAAMRDYSRASGIIKEMEKTLSVSDKAMQDTTLRKLLSSQRDNVNTNFGRRAQLVEDLAKYEPDLPYALAGQNLSSLEPRGLARVGPGLNAIYGIVHADPMAAAAFPFLSPRIMGEATYAAGQAAGAAGKAASATGLNRVSPAAVAAGGRVARQLGGQAQVTEPTRLEDQRPPTEEERQALARQLMAYGYLGR